MDKRTAEATGRRRWMLLDMDTGNAVGFYSTMRDAGIAREAIEAANPEVNLWVVRPDLTGRTSKRGITQ